MKMQIALAALLITCASSPANADEEVYTSPTLEVCFAEAHHAMQKLISCDFKEATLLEDTMTKTYDEALAHATDPRIKEFLEASQTAWINYRDAWCKALTPFGHSDRTMILHAHCLINEDQSRTKALNHFMGR